MVVNNPQSYISHELLLYGELQQCLKSPRISQNLETFFFIIEVIFLLIFVPKESGNPISENPIIFTNHVLVFIEIREKRRSSMRQNLMKNPLIKMNYASLYTFKYISVFLTNDSGPILPLKMKLYFIRNSKTNSLFNHENK